MLESAPTIFALSSGRGHAGVAVIRLSGTGAGGALEALTGTLPRPRHATLAPIATASAGLIDRGLVLWFPAPHSVTGEDVAELQVHGGPAIVSAVLAALGALPGLRPAEAGEFTRRAFHNGKLDLTQVEALADAVRAETEAQRIQAVRQMEGEMGRLIEAWRAQVLAALAHVEAAIDFADEELPEDVMEAAAARVEAMLPAADALLEDGRRGERLRDGVEVVLLGAPNVGKSSLLNRLARRDAAIVSAAAGTTRDVLEVHLDIGGYPVILADTAGLREAAEGVEGEGVRRALARAESADVKIALFDGGGWPDVDAATAAMVDGDTTVAVNKSDLLADTGPISVCGRAALLVSAKTGAGLAVLIAAVEAKVEEKVGLAEQPWLTRARHRDALVACTGHLRRFLELRQGSDIAVAAEELRLAARALGRITGRVDVEDILDIVFEDFCIGK